MLIPLNDVDRLRQWFDAICDVSPEFLDSDDYRLGLSLYDACGMRPSNKLQKAADATPLSEIERLRARVLELEVQLERMEHGTP